jgi:hypothetical protein
VCSATWWNHSPVGERNCASVLRAFVLSMMRTREQIFAPVF